MRIVEGHRLVEQWRDIARDLLRTRTPWSEVEWIDPDEGQTLLAAASHEPGNGELHAAARGADASSSEEGNKPGGAMRVPAAFMSVAERVLCHTDPARWAVLYRVLWRLTLGGERGLMSDAADPDVRKLALWEKAVRRDVHKMKAFVRFRRVTSDDGAGGSREHYVAWHRPDYHVLRLVGGFFARRFGVMTWSILTPRGTLHWDGETLTEGSAVGRHEAPNDDALEDLWRTYYKSVFNPARLNERAMKREMPVRHWGTLPEATLIDDLVRAATGRVGEMMAMPQKLTQTAADFIPEGRVTLPVLREVVQGCRGCDLYKQATQAVFGEGPAKASLMLVGEQPGDQEDIEGRPFVGPAGQLLDRAMIEAGMTRQDVYITNAVKHFKWTPEPRGKRRIHSKPSVGEVKACRPWLEREIALVKPKAIVLLGATAAQSLMGAAFRITKDRGRVIAGGEWAPVVIATFHPSAILRAPDEGTKAEQFALLVQDLKLGMKHASL